MKKNLNENKTLLIFYVEIVEFHLSQSSMFNLNLYNLKMHFDLYEFLFFDYGRF